MSNAACRPRVPETKRQRDGASNPLGPIGHSMRSSLGREPNGKDNQILRIKHVPLAEREWGKPFYSVGTVPQDLCPQR